MQEEDDADGDVLRGHTRTQPDFGGQEAGLKCSSIDEEETLSTPMDYQAQKSGQHIPFALPHVAERLAPAIGLVAAQVQRVHPPPARPLAPAQLLRALG